MNYMTIKEASTNWGIGTRIITVYCMEWRIDGAVKKGNLRLIPEGSTKPEDKRRKKSHVQTEQEEKGTVEYKHSNDEPFQPLYENKELFVQIIKNFPYPIHICAPDGTMLFTNEAFSRFLKVSDPPEDLRKYNILNNPLEKWGIKDFVMRSYKGEIAHAYDVKVPLLELVMKHGGNTESISEIMFQNMTAFPIHDENHQLAYIVTVFTTSRYYQGKEEVMKGKEYIDEHWKEKFDADKLSGIVHMSKHHYARLFKQQTGMTPNNYHQSVKLGKLKQMLCNSNLSITQVFEECGVDYNGNLAKKLRKELGMTPSEYRVMMTKK